MKAAGFLWVVPFPLCPFNHSSMRNVENRKKSKLFSDTLITSQTRLFAKILLFKTRAVKVNVITR